MYAQIDKGVDGTAPILVKSYKVTSGRWPPSRSDLAQISERVPAPGEQRQRIAREGAEVVGQRRRGDRTRCDGLKADQALEADCRGDLGIVDGLEAARGALERILVGQGEAGPR